MAGGFSGTVWAMTARVSGSIFYTASQHGHSTSNIAFAFAMFSSYRGAGVFACNSSSLNYVRPESRRL